MIENTYYCTFVGNQYIICECGESFPNEETLREHLEKDPHVSFESSYTEYKCGECSRIFATEQECIDHQELEHVPITKVEHTYIKDEQEMYFKEEPVYIKTEPKVDHSYTKDEQEVHVKQEPVYMKTEPLYVEAVPEEDWETMIDVETVSPKPRGRRQDVQVTSFGVKKKKKKKSYNVKNVICEVCGKKYASNAALRYHQRVHTGVRPYQCSYCPKNFTMGLFLQIHIRTHTGEKPYQCPHCPKAFGNRAALLRHDRVHTGVKPYECPKCGKFFTQSNSMKLHVHTVHLKMPAPYKSKRRKAESEAREARGRTTLHTEPLQYADLEYSEIQLVQPETEMKLELEQVEQPCSELEGAEVYYCDIPPKGEEEEITYEFIL